MRRSLLASAVLLVGVLGTAGCRHTLWTSPVTNALAWQAPSEDPKSLPPQQLPAVAPPASAVATDPSAPVTQQQALAAITPDLQALAASDPAAHQQLLMQLQTLPPAMWQVTTQQFRATLAYAAERAQQQSPARPEPTVIPAPQPINAVATTPRPQPLFAAPGATQSGTTAKVIEPAPAPEPTKIVVQEPPAAPLPSPPSEPAAPLRIENAHVDATEQGSQVKLVTAEMPRRAKPQAAEWRENLDAAITQLETEAPRDPRNTREAYQHARLRLMQLAAGDDEAALAPIAGLPAAEQGYWSKQLFAVSTLLDASTQPDLSRRAALASTQLEEATGQLADVAALTVKNAAFCREVLGFGAYEPLAKPRFKPGAHAKLYLEVANYRSDSTAEGYHTTLDTSYRVLDKSGAVVESKDFPSIDDYCLTRRRDFHIQYDTDLPTKIYSGKYRLELTLRDRLGDKIGQTTIDFEIE